MLNKLLLWNLCTSIINEMNSISMICSKSSDVMIEFPYVYCIVNICVIVEPLMNGPYHCWDLQYYSIKIVNIFTTIISVSYFNIVFYFSQSVKNNLVRCTGPMLINSKNTVHNEELNSQFTTTLTLRLPRETLSPRFIDNRRHSIISFWDLYKPMIICV